MNQAIGITGAYLNWPIMVHRDSYSSFIFYLARMPIILTTDLPTVSIISMFFFFKNHEIDTSSFTVAGQNLYYGSNYYRLKSLKDQYDPNDTFNFPLAIEE